MKSKLTLALGLLSFGAMAAPECSIESTKYIKSPHGVQTGDYGFFDEIIYHRCSAGHDVTVEFTPAMENRRVRSGLNYEIKLTNNDDPNAYTGDSEANKRRCSPTQELGERATGGCWFQIQGSEDELLFETRVRVTYNSNEIALPKSETINIGYPIKYTLNPMPVSLR